MRRLVDLLPWLLALATVIGHYAILGCAADVTTPAEMTASAASSSSSSTAATSSSASASTGAGGAMCVPETVGDHLVQAQCDPQTALDCDGCGDVDAGDVGVCCFGRCVKCCPLPGDAGTCEP